MMKEGSMLKNLLKTVFAGSILVSALTGPVAQAQTAYIKAGDAKVKKSNLAFQN